MHIQSIQGYNHNLKSRNLKSKNLMKTEHLNSQPSFKGHNGKVAGSVIGALSGFVLALAISGETFALGLTTLSTCMYGMLGCFAGDKLEDKINNSDDDNWLI